MLIKSVIFIIISAGITFYSWRSLRNWRSHGFFRFFAFESILMLVLLNAEYWFREPFSPLQLASWFLLLCSVVMAGHGFYLLHVIGRPERGIENTSVLVTRGVYRYIRHPLYASLLLLAWGVFFKNPSLIAGVLALAATAFLVATARVEEADNLQKFGADYAAYMKKTRMFIPFLI